MRNIIIIAAGVVLLGGLLAFVSWQEEPVPMTAARQEPAEKLAMAPAKAPTAQTEAKLAAPSSAASPVLPTARKNIRKSTPAPQQPAPSALKAPSFDIVRVAKDRTAVIAGRAPAGSIVRLMLDGQVLADAPTSKRGEWVVVVDKPLPSGQAELDLLAIMPDGRSIAAESVVALMVPQKKAPAETTRTTAAKTAPAKTTPAKPAAVKKQQRTALAVLLPKSADAPAKLLQKPEPKGGSSRSKLSVDTVDYDDKGNVVVTGSAPKGARVRAYVDNKPVGIAQADQAKGWQLKPKAEVAPGGHTLRVDQLDDSGKVVNRIELPFVRVAAAEVLASTKARYRVIVQPGNSLWRIARRVYGSGNRYTVIYQANNGQIRDPDMIFPGQVFSLPTEN